MVSVVFAAAVAGFSLAGLEIEYLDVGRAAERGPLAQCWQVPFEAVAPATESFVTTSTKPAPMPATRRPSNTSSAGGNCSRQSGPTPPGTTLADQFSVDQDVVRQALTSYVPSPPGTRKTLHSPSLEPVRDHIAAMVTAAPAITATTIWEQLVDHHHIDISYATVRDYLAREHHRPATGRIPDPQDPHGGPVISQQTISLPMRPEPVAQS